MAATKDRGDWARWTQLQIDQRAGGNQSRYGQLVGVPKDRVGRWLRGEDPKPEAVRQVCTSLGVSVVEGMIIAGILRRTDVVDVPVVELRDPTKLTKRELLAELDRRLPPDVDTAEQDVSGSTVTPMRPVPVIRPEGRRGTDWAARPRPE